MAKVARLFAVAVLVFGAFIGCRQTSSPVQSGVVYFVSPQAATTGSDYATGATVYVPGAGNLSKAGYVLAGWNTIADGSGASYAVGATFTMGASDLTLYAVWIPEYLQFVAYGTTIAISACIAAPSASLTIPGGVTGILSEAFAGIAGLTSVAIPPSVASIGLNAFYGCAALASVTVQAATPPSLPPASAAFDHCAAAGVQIAVPAASANAYKAASGWSTYAAQIVSQ